MWNYRPVLYPGSVLIDNVSSDLFQIFFIGGKKQAFGVIVVLRYTHFIILIVVFDVVFFDEFVLRHSGKVYNGLS